ncbi:hypothetical protein PO002_33610 [Cupriavidus necator]|uniref:hypothetical protein n=1 Tax=Cupriavidus necator TaxID=106590 RepID=UPI0039C47A12
MKKALGSLLVLAVALGLLAALGFGAWLGLQFLITVVAAWDPPTRSLAIGVAAGVPAVLWVAHAVRQAGRDRVAVPHREEKAAAYRLFAECWSVHLRQLASPPPALREAETSLEVMLALCASAAMIESHTMLRELSARPDARADALRPLLAGALKTARKELGAEDIDSGAIDALLWPGGGDAADEEVPESLPASRLSTA